MKAADRMMSNRFIVSREAKTMADAADLIGSWKLISFTRTSVETGDVTNALGDDPVGYIAYYPGGRMMAAVFSRDRPRPGGAGYTVEQKAALFDSMIAYTAAYSLEDDKVIHHVDHAWNPTWQTDLLRPFTLNGDRLEISNAPSNDPVTGEAVIYRLEFQKV
jgi:hypothetical protein